MALDVGAVAAFDSGDASSSPAEAPFVISPPSLQAGPHIGAALKAIREFKGHSLDFISGATRVRPSQLEAIEAFDLERLPSRPFAIGYVRAYAEALGQDPEAAVERFKRDTPPPEPALRAPVGDDLRSRAAMGGRHVGVFVVAGVVVLSAVIAWNVTRRIATPRLQASETAVSQAALNEATAAASSGPVSIGGPVPAPPEASSPRPYVTPGLAAATAAGGSADAAIADRAARANQPPAPPADLVQPPVGSAFVPGGTVFGVGPEMGSVVIQATVPALLIVRGSDQTPYFARQLHAGEAYRVPNVAGLSVEASSLYTFRVYGPAGYRGLLTQTLTPLSSLGQAAGAPTAPRAAARPAPAAARR
jgi:cytoskeletal protein RodZ